MGTVNNIIQVKKTDFEVFDALMVDSQKCSDVSGECQTSVRLRLYWFVSYALCHPRLDFFPFILSDLSSSPPGPYHQDAYVPKQEEKFKSPPILPPHLLQVILNKDTGISVSFCIYALYFVCKYKLATHFIRSILLVKVKILFYLQKCINPS